MVVTPGPGSGRGAPLMAASSARFLIASLLCSCIPTAAGKNGIVGFGISLYPDLCCQTCHDSLSSLYLTCTTFMSMQKRGMGDSTMMGMTSDECRAGNTAWLQTMAYCIQRRCDTDRYPADKQEECFRNQAVAGAPGPTFRDSLPATPPTVELSRDAMWLNTTSLVNSQLYDARHGTLAEFARSENMHTRYSYVPLFPSLPQVQDYETHTPPPSPGSPSISWLSASASPAVCWLRPRAYLLGSRGGCTPPVSGRSFSSTCFSLPCSGLDVSNLCPDSLATCRAGQSASSSPSTSS